MNFVNFFSIMENLLVYTNIYCVVARIGSLMSISDGLRIYNDVSRQVRA